MNKVSVQSLNECFNISGDNFIWIDNDDYEPCSYCSFVGEKHPQFGVAKTKEQKEHQSKMIENWWKNLTDEKKKTISKNRAKSVKKYWGRYTDEERKLLRNWSPPKMCGKENPRYGKQSASKGKIWITNGEINRMVNPYEMPEGWYRGRIKVHNDNSKEILKDKMSKDNPNAKKYKIIFRDGTEQVVKQLSTWARENGHNYSNIKSIVHRTKYKKERQYECYNSPTYYIKEIWAI